MPPGFLSREPRENPGTFPPFYIPSTSPNPKNLLLQRHDCITLHESFLWARHQHNSQGCQKVSFFFIYLFYQTKAEVDWKAEEVFWGASQQCRSPLPLLCCALLKPPRPLTRLRFIKDLLRRVFIMSLTFEDSSFGCLECEGARSWQTTSCFFFFFPVTALAGCQQRKCDIICSKLSAHTKWHKAAHTSRCSDKQLQLPQEDCTYPRHASSGDMWQQRGNKAKSTPNVLTLTSCSSVLSWALKFESLSFFSIGNCG